MSASPFSGVLLTDLDNTIYNWVDFWAPSFRAMVHVLNRKTGLPEEEILEQFRSVYAAHGSVEYSFSVQELPFVASLPKEEVDDLVKAARGAFRRVREKRLQPYPGVKETLRQVHEARIAIVAVTNAPVFLTNRRLHNLHIAHLFAGLAAWEGFAVASDNPYVQQREWRTKIGQEWSLPKSDLKPNPDSYLRVLKDLGIPPELCWVVGDSLRKDIAPALDIGAHGIWATYGNTWKEENFKTLLAVTHWNQASIDSTYSEDEVEPTHTIGSFKELLNILPVQLELQL